MSMNSSKSISYFALCCVVGKLASLIVDMLWIDVSHSSPVDVNDVERSTINRFFKSMTIP